VTEFVLYGGKGGVGKTTMATASALRLAREGHETLVVSTDPAHSLSDSLEVELSGEPTEIRDHLWGVEVDPQDGIDRYQELFDTLNEELDDAGIRTTEEGDLFASGVMPGSDELAALEGLATYVDTEQYDRVVFDTAPTGHTLRLLDLPDVLEQGMEAALEIHDQVQRKVNVSRTLFMGPLAFTKRKSGSPDELVSMRDRMEQVGEVLRDPEQTSFRVVTIPETMAVNETRRLVEQLRDFDVPVTTLVVNMVIEDPGDCERCRAKQAVQEEAIADLRELLPELDVWLVPDQPGQVTGLDSLEDVADALGEV
jgi:arsenite-transporting ATPase